MKIKKLCLLLVGMFFIAAMNSCVNDKEVERQEIGESRIRLFVNGVTTRTIDGDINKGILKERNKVGAFGVILGDDNPSFEYISKGQNNEYKVGVNGELTAEEEMSAKENTENVKVIAYAPYNEEWDTYNETYAFTVASDQSDEEGYLASDLLYAEGEKIDKVTLDQEAVSLTFVHKLARVQLNIELADDLNEDFSEAKVIVNNTKPGISFKPSTGEIEGVAQGDTNDIIAVSELGVNRTAYAVVVPQTIATGITLFTIQLPEKKYTLTLSNDVTFEEGKSYSFTVNIISNMSEELEIKLDESPWVYDWDNGNEDADNPIESVSLDPYHMRLTSSGTQITWVTAYDQFILSWRGEGITEEGLKVLPYNVLTSINVADCLKFKSLVFVIENYSKAETALEASLVVGSSTERLFRSSETEIFKMNTNGTFAIDFTNYRNIEIMVGASQICIYGLTNGLNYQDFSSAKIAKVYLTTQKASTIN